MCQVGLVAAVLGMAGVLSGIASADALRPGPAADAIVETAEPPVPPRGSRPVTMSRSGAVRVALVDSGVDYRIPPILDALARHVNGSIVGVDFRDLDNRPFDRQDLPGERVQRHGTRTASVVIAEAPGIAFVPYRFPGQDMRLMHALVEHAAANEVRVIGLPLGSDRLEQWRAFELAARAHPELLFVASAGNDGRDLDTRPLYPASLDLDNLVAVSSADDFMRVAQGSGTGHASVDYLVPAEAIPVIDFGGERRVAAGSSYAVPRVVALAARLIAANPRWRASEVIAAIRSKHANGLSPRDVGEGLIVDPMEDTTGSVRTRAFAGRTLLDAALASNSSRRELPVDLYVLDETWSARRIVEAVIEADRILDQCGVDLVLGRADVAMLDTNDRLRDLDAGAAKTLLERLGRTGPKQPAAIVFARDTRMQTPFDAEAFGRGNTRDRPWLANSVWLTLALEDEGIALAHELFHVVANAGTHVEAPANLMLGRTTGDNRNLDREQCEAALEAGLDAGLIR